MTEAKGPARETALVLHTLRHGDTSRIATLFCRSRGRVTVIAKGARSGKRGAAGGIVDTPNLIEALIYFKASRSVQTLGSVTLINDFGSLKQNLRLSVYGTVIAEFLNRSLGEGEPNEAAFSAALSALTQLDAGIYDPILALWKFQLELLNSIGFALEAFTCPVCGRSESTIGQMNLLWLETGAICCTNCRPRSGTAIPLSGDAVALIRQLSRNNDGMLQHLVINGAVRRDLTAALTRYLAFHHPRLGATPALNLLAELEEVSSRSARRVASPPVLK